MKHVAVLGATGSIGTSALDVIARHPQRFRASVLSAHRNADALFDLCLRFAPDIAVLVDAEGADALRARLAAAGSKTRLETGAGSLRTVVAGPHCDTVIAAIVGAAGLESTLAAARAGKRLLLANKEAVVMAGGLLLDALREGGGDLIPIDSEHNAIVQCLPERRADLARAGARRITLTASGGPFRGCARADLADVTPEQACAHPKWRMGRKISVDSATLMNKGLEVIEAHWLFGAAADQIDVVVHPESIVHSLVEYPDGSVLAQMANPDMRTTLAQALAWPDRVESGVAPLDLLAIGRLNFEAPDRATFRCLDLAYAALTAGGGAAIALNAANEVAVEAFLGGTLPFLAIAEVIEQTLGTAGTLPADSLDAVVYADLTARREAQRMIRRRFVQA
jgi:1-deoxy-D-xylulose-5-phosphate reductoisomerase